MFFSFIILNQNFIDCQLNESQCCLKMDVFSAYKLEPNLILIYNSIYFVAGMWVSPHCSVHCACVLAHAHEHVLARPTSEHPLCTHRLLQLNQNKWTLVLLA